MCRLVCLFIIGSLVPSIGITQTIASKKPAAGELPTNLGLGAGGWYGAVEMRHHLATFYDNSGDSMRQEPTTHVRLQLGGQLYDGMVDVYVNVGAYKRPQTLQVLQRRSELSLDLRPFRSQYFELLQYSLIKLPFRQQDPDPEAQEQEISVGSVFVIGLAPSLRLPIESRNIRYNLMFGVEAWTKLYSRKQYTDNQATEMSEENEGRLALASEQENSETIEDFAPHYNTQSLLGIQLIPFVLLPGLKLGLSSHYHTLFHPVYSSKDGSVEYKYSAERYSYFTGKIEYALSARFSVINEFSAYYDRFFQDQRVGLYRRYRNLMRLVCRL